MPAVNEAQRISAQARALRKGLRVDLMVAVDDT
jgi:hypothetical protein